MSAPVWFDDDNFRVDDVDFVYSFGSSTLDRFCIRKPRRLVESTIALLDRFEAPRIFEFGIASGGSTALIAVVSEPAKLVAVELATERVAALDELIERRGLSSRVRPVYGVDQADRQRISAIADDEFGADRLDLVIDDASHRLEESRSSFETLFPRLRTDGLYVIEDWNWHMQLRYALAGRPGDPDGADLPRAAREPIDADDEASRAALREYVKENVGLTPLETLAFELVAARASSGHAVREVIVGEHWVVVRRGPAPLDSGSFRLADNYVPVPVPETLVREG